VIRECPLCGLPTSARWCCGLDLSARRRWVMSYDRIRAVHVLALSIKGLDEETYRLRLSAVGVDTCKDLSRAQFAEFMRGLRALPDKCTFVDSLWPNALRAKGRAA
jgi:hypothetical protein